MKAPKYLICYWDDEVGAWEVCNWANSKREAERRFKIAKSLHQHVALTLTVEEDFSNG